jgi:hypothetical protein
MAGTIVADNIQAASTSTLVIKNGVANTPPTIQDSAGTQIGTFCRAWVNFNGTGTVAIRASFNVSSITDNGTGDYTVNFTNALPDANYMINGTSSLPSGGSDRRVVATNLNTTPTTSAVRISVGYGSTADDQSYVQVAVFR